MDLRHINGWFSEPNQLTRWHQTSLNRVVKIHLLSQEASTQTLLLGR